MCHHVLNSKSELSWLQILVKQDVVNTTRYRDYEEDNERAHSL